MDGDNKYSRAIKVPQYNPSDVMPSLNELVNTDKYRNLMAKIKKSGVSDREKVFLQFAATRHIVFTYSKIADYYAHASKEMQELMEDSALVILDMNDAIANGYVKLTEKMQQLIEEEKERDAKAKEAKKILKEQQLLMKEKLKEESNKDIKEMKKQEYKAVKDALENDSDLPIDLDDPNELASEMDESNE